MRAITIAIAITIGRVVHRMPPVKRWKVTVVIVGLVTLLLAAAEGSARHFARAPRGPVHTLAWVGQRVLGLEPALVVDLDGNDGFEALRDDWDPAGLVAPKSRTPRFHEWLTGTSRFAGLLSELAQGGDPDPRDRARRQT